QLKKTGMRPIASPFGHLRLQSRSRAGAAVNSAPYPSPIWNTRLHTVATCLREVGSAPRRILLVPEVDGENDDVVGVSHGAILLPVRRVANGPMFVSLPPARAARKKPTWG